MKFLFFYRDFLNGGVQRNLLRLAELLIARGHAVHFAVAYSADNEFALPNGLVSHRLTAGNPLAMARQLAGLIDAVGPDLVYSAMPNYNAVAVGARALSRAKPKLVISERSHTTIELKNTKLGIYKASILLSPVIYRFADKIIAVSRETAVSLADFMKVPVQDISVVHNPVVSDKLRAMAAAPVEHEWLGAPYKLIVATGRLVHQKDYPTLLRAMQSLLVREPEARLVIIGQGELEAELRALAGELGIMDKVDFRGFDANPYRWMSRCRVFVLASLWEGLPTVIIEALACGATIVATDSPSGPRQVLGDRFGYLAPMSQPEALAAELARGLASPLDEAMLKQEAETYSETASVEAFLSVVGATLAGKRAA